MNEGRRPRTLPFVFLFTLGMIGILFATPWRQQTPWAMVCTTVVGVIALVLSYMGDLPDGDDEP